MAENGGTVGVFNSLNVMIVEDESLAARLVELLLETLGVGNVVTAETGEAAIEKLGEGGLDIDLIISDIEMPGMDGYEFIRRIRYGAVPGVRDVPILVLTGKDTEKNVRRSRTHRISGFLVKPPTAESLEKHIREALGL